MARTQGIRLILDRYAPATQGIFSLFLFDTAANLVDYGFHIFVGRSLAPGNFAAFQTINAFLLVMITTAGVFQPVIARFVAEAEVQPDRSAALTRSSRGIFQSGMVSGAAIGLVLGCAVWFLRESIAAWMNIPPITVAISAAAVFFALLRPVVSGMLQGLGRFISFGLTRIFFSIARLLFAVGLSGLGLGLVGMVVSLPLGLSAAVLGGLVILGRSVWKPADRLAGRALVDGLQLSTAALLAYAAHTTLLNLDLWWVNRSFTPALAGAYATGVIFRRALLLLPGAVSIVLLPRVARTVASKRCPDNEIGLAIALSSAAVLAGSGVYFIWGDELVWLAFGAAYQLTGPLLGWMGLAIWGYSLAIVWMNVFLATRPSPYVALLVGALVLQGLLYLYYADRGSLELVALFAAGGGVLAVGGGLLYAGWLRPRLQAGFLAEA